MCGIAGIVDFRGQPVATSDLEGMASLLGHRGPDGSGTWAAGPVGFAHRRLSIIDVEGSVQPMVDADNQACIVFNGEILNYRDLRAELADVRLRTHGDTEVLLELFLRHGLDAVKRLRGQFAFAFFDQRRQEAWLVRDRLGILPLYYAVDGSRLLFASEPKALLPLLTQGPRVDEWALDDYLAHRAVPAPRTLFAGVRKVRPGHALRVDLAGRVEEVRYWSIPMATNAPAMAPGEAVDLVDAGLRAAVSDCLVADVPIGAYLSGGVDSSLVVAIMAQLAGGSIETFSAGFGDPRFDELPFARQVSDLLGTRHHEVHLNPADFMSEWGRLTWHRDAPLSEPADVAVYALAREARKRVKVVLSGEGSDELFAGYPKYRYAAHSAAAGRVPTWLRTGAARGVESMAAGRAPRLRIAARAMGGRDERELLRGWFAPFTERERVELLGSRRAAPASIAFPPADPLKRMLWFDCQGWLSDNLLERGDRMSMAASLELRPPFLDARLIELAFALPSALKVRDGQLKWLVKRVAERYLPEALVNRRKVGFRAPLDAWFRGGLAKTSAEMLLDERSFATRYLGRRPIERLLRSHSQGVDEHIRIWTLLGLEMWHDTFFRQGAGAAGRQPAALLVRR